MFSISLTLHFIRIFTLFVEIRVDFVYDVHKFRTKKKPEKTTTTETAT